MLRSPGATLCRRSDRKKYLRKLRLATSRCKPAREYGKAFWIFGSKVPGLGLANADF
jgi:hypothetical protein